MKSGLSFGQFQYLWLISFQEDSSNLILYTCQLKTGVEKPAIQIFKKIQNIFMLIEK